MAWALVIMAWSIENPEEVGGGRSGEPILGVGISVLFCRILFHFVAGWGSR